MIIYQYNTLLKDNGACELVLKAKIDYPGEPDKFDTPVKIFKLLTNVYQHGLQTEEYLYLLCLDNQCHLTGIFEIAHGSADNIIVTPKEIFQKALLANAYTIILAHNHPNGYLGPSDEDLDFILRIKQCGDLMDIPLSDNLIITQDDYYSMRQQSTIMG